MSRHLEVGAKLDRGSYRPGELARLVVEVADEDTLVITRTVEERDHRGAERRSIETAIWHQATVTVEAAGNPWQRGQQRLINDGRIAVLRVEYAREVDTDDELVQALVRVDCPLGRHDEQLVSAFVEDPAEVEEDAAREHSRVEGLVEDEKSPY